MIVRYYVALPLRQYKDIPTLIRCGVKRFEHALLGYTSPKVCTSPRTLTVSPCERAGSGHKTNYPPPAKCVYLKLR